jgi:hypothetical protein
MYQLVRGEMSSTLKEPMQKMHGSSQVDVDNDKSLDFALVTGPNAEVRFKERPDAKLNVSLGLLMRNHRGDLSPWRNVDEVFV